MKQRYRPLARPVCPLFDSRGSGHTIQRMASWGIVGPFQGAGPQCPWHLFSTMGAFVWQPNTNSPIHRLKKLKWVNCPVALQAGRNRQRAFLTAGDFDRHHRLHQFPNFLRRL
jgi:hypothetical protein